MRLARIICIVLIFIPTILFAKVTITEVAWMGIAGTNGQFGEWIELYNDSVDAADLTDWKFFSGGGGDLVFTLTKSIPAKSYFLIERTTTSVPDPVPGVQDASGPFGSGGFSNNGEDLVLKDSGGTTIQTLSYGTGWPAGDATTKETMQWNGTGWVTAPATPKAPFAGPVPPPEEQTPPTNTGTSQDNRAPKATPHIEFSLPKVLYTGVSYELQATPVFEYSIASWGIFRWNLGDGTVVEQTRLDPIQHTYSYPGTYSISFSYFQSPYDKTPRLSGTQSVVVSSPVLQVQVLDAGRALMVTNTDDTIVDLSGWTLRTRLGSVVLPQATYIPADATTVLTARGLGIDSLVDARFESPEGSAITTPLPFHSLTNTPSQLNRSEAPEEASAFDTSQLIASSDTALALPATSPKRNRTKVVIFGAITFVIISLSILLERFMAQKE